FAQQRLDRAERRSLDQPLEPAVRGQGLRRIYGRFERAASFLVVRGDVHEPRCKTAPAPARTPLRPDDPAPQLDRLLSSERHGEGRVGGVEQMMALVEQ